jgi:aspartyl-tRNA(Asn)/glutamyl-tRNA(Gln) amidotransferase subunit B
MSEAGLASGWEMVIGLEVHCELATRSKLFCGCPNAFGDEPNTNICPVCLGLPGSLPVLNRQAVELAMRIGLALNCEIAPSTFHRKNYFYPDMPKDFQISQYDAPINRGGRLELPDGSVVGIERAHIEEDTGKTTHIGGTGRIGGAEYALVDYNRAGVPLVEIVSAPDIGSAAQARAYAGELRSILIATQASDGRMEEGSMRVDANVSVRRVGEGFGTRCEVKNLNSMRSLIRAIDFEADRQVTLLEGGGRVIQETRHWDEGEGRTLSMRSKEEANDYRYFPEPDLVALAPDVRWQGDVAASLPPMPAQRRAALAQLLGGAPSPAEVDQIRSVVASDLDHLVMSASERGAPASLALARTANEVAANAERAPDLDPARFAELLVLEQCGELSATQAKDVLAELLVHGGDPAAIAKAMGFEAMDAASLAGVVAEVVGSHPLEWEKFVAGEQKMAGVLTGEVMKATRGKANGASVAAELARLRSEAGG